MNFFWIRSAKENGAQPHSSLGSGALKGSFKGHNGENNGSPAP